MLIIKRNIFIEKIMYQQNLFKIRTKQTTFKRISGDFAPLSICPNVESGMFVRVLELWQSPTIKQERF